jgi:hypothetical protein
MFRRRRVISLFVIVLAFAGAAAGGAQPLPWRRIVVSVAWPAESEQAEHEAQPATPHGAQPSATAALRVPRSTSVRRSVAECSLFQRPPPSTSDRVSRVSLQLI